MTPEADREEGMCRGAPLRRAAAPRKPVRLLALRSQLHPINWEDCRARGDVPPRNLLARVGWPQPAQGRSWVPMQDPERNQCSSDAGPRLTTVPTQQPFDPHAV